MALFRTSFCYNAGMDWNAFGFLLIIIIIGYAPYKLLQKFKNDGLNDISPLVSFFLALWFIILSAALLIQSTGAFIKTSPAALFLFVTTTTVWVFAPFVVRKFGSPPIKLIQRRKGTFVLRLEPKTFYLKYFEVIFQQVKFLFMLAVVFSAFPYELKIFWFVAIIGFFHFNNIFFLPKGEGWVFFALSFPMAIFFSWMILNGWILVTTSIHLWFYILLGGYPWMIKKLR